MSNLLTLALIGCAMALGPRVELVWRAARAWVRHRYGT